MSKPRVIIYNSISLDGRLENSIDMGLYYGLAATWTNIEPLSGCAMLSGSETILTGFAGQEDPAFELPAEPKQTIPGAVPYLAVVDGRGRIRSWKQLQAQPYWLETLALFSNDTPNLSVQTARQAGVPIITAGSGHVDLRAALDELNTRFGIHTVRVDSGGTLNGVLLQQGLVDEVSVLLCGVLTGSHAPAAFFGGESVQPAMNIPLKLFHVEQVQENILWLRYEVVHP
ncbi:MAG: dihydrofolate reductase family protein [Anaerolineaceae bacterium]